MAEKTKKRWGLRVALILMALGLVLFIIGCIWVKNTDMIKYQNLTDINESYNAADIDRIELDMSVGDVRILQSEDDEIHINGKIPEAMKITTENNTFKLYYDKQKQSGFHIVYVDSDFITFLGSDNIKFSVSLPEKIYEQLNVSFGVGNLEVKDISCKNAELDFGIGDINGENICVKDRVNVKMGIGELELNKCLLGKSKFDLGIGDVDFSGYLGGDTDISCGIGSADFKLQNSENNKYNINKDMGISDFDISYGNDLGLDKNMLK